MLFLDYLKRKDDGKFYNSDEEEREDKLRSLKLTTIVACCICTVSMCVNVVLMTRVLGILNGINNDSIYRRMATIEATQSATDLKVEEKYGNLLETFKYEYTLADEEIMNWEKTIEERVLGVEELHEKEQEEARQRLNMSPVMFWSYDFGQSCLTPMGGVYYFGSQKETYYNLNMSAVVNIAHSRGIEGEYWIREDGCKMLGDYIMLAAEWTVHPYGSLVETSLGTGIVVDTGGFGLMCPTQIDIATAW